MNKFAVLLAVSILFFVNPVSSINFSVTPTETSLTLGWGETEDSSVEITSQNSWYSMNCDIIKDEEVITEVNNIGSGETKSGSYLLTAPSSGSGTRVTDMSVYCKDGYGAEKTKSYTVDVNYPLEGQREAYTLIEDVEGRIDSASSKISEAEDKISEAERIGASVNEAIDRVDSARNDLDGANTYISGANTAYDNNNFRSAQDDATIAENKAESAVDDAKNAIDRARAAIQQRRNDAEEEINSASGKLEELQSAIGKLEDKIEKASSNGLDVSGEEQTLENSRGMLSDVESSLDEARTSSDNGNYGEALNDAEDAFQKASSALDNVRSTVGSLEESIPASGSSSVPLSVESTVKNLLDDDQEVSQEKAELRANNFENSGLSITKAAVESTYSVESIYAHPSGETVTLSSTVNTAEGRVGDVSLSGDASQINQGWKETQSAQQTRNSVLMFAGAAILLIISGTFAYYFVNPVNKTVNNFVGEDGESGSGRTFNCSNCDAPISPDDLEDGECPYCGATVSI